MEERNQKRPDGDAGSNWARCRECEREASRIRNINHRKHCSARQQSSQQSVATDAYGAGELNRCNAANYVR